MKMKMKVNQHRVSNPMPYGYWDLMVQIDREQEASDAQERYEASVLEALQDDELIGAADEAVSELFTSHYDAMIKIMNEIAKAMVIGGYSANQSVKSLLSCLPVEAEEEVKKYLFDNAKLEENPYS